MRAETIIFAGPAAAWNPDDQEKFRALAGSQFLRVEGPNAIVLSADGQETTVYPGWIVTRPDGSGDGQAVFDTPNRVRVTED
jgi:hypothetical protein